MSKHDDYLTEIAYEIDEIMYDYYTRSNHLIAQRRNQDKLISYRDKSIETVNDMNVRSLQILAGIRNVDLMKERAEILLSRNEEILASSLDVINSSPLKSDFLEDVTNIAISAYAGALDALDNFANSDTYESIKKGASKGYTKLKDTIESISKEPKVKETIDVVKVKSKELVHVGEEVAVDAYKKIEDWMATDEVVEDNETPSNEVLDYVNEVIQHVEEENKESLSLVEQAQKQIDEINSKHDLEQE